MGLKKTKNYIYMLIFFIAERSPMNQSAQSLLLSPDHRVGDDRSPVLLPNTTRNARQGEGGFALYGGAAGKINRSTNN